MAHKTILTVEDDDIFADYLNVALTDLGYAVLEPVATGEDAIDRARAQKPDLILMDINLAGEMDGIAAADHIQSFLDVPIIYLTGNSEAPFLQRVGITTPYGYLVKPVSSQELAATIEISLYRHALDMKLKVSDDRLKLALASSHMGVWERNVATNEVFWSPECYEVFGSIDFNGTFESFVSFLHPEDVPRIMAAIGQVSMERSTFRTEFRIVRPDGEVRWLVGSGRGYFDASGVPLRLIGTVQDITERKRAEEELRWSEQRFRSLFETSRDSILLIDQETVRIVGANPAACRLYGYSPEEFLTLKVTDTSAEPEKTEAAVLQSVPKVLFRLHRKKDGTIFPVEISGGYFTEGDLRLHTAFIRDITDRTKAEEQLLIANFGIESSISAVRFADLDGRVTSVNDSFIRLWGYERADEVVGRHISELAMSGTEAEGIKALRSGRGYIGESRAKRKDGSPFDVQVAVSIVTTDEGKPICTMASFIDITERKQAEEALRESEEHYRVAIESSNDGVALLRGGTHIFVNRKLLDMFGYDAAEEVIGKPLFMTIHPDDREMVARYALKGERGEPAPSSYEFRGITKAGTTKHIEASVARVTYLGEPAGLAYLRDITERKRAEEKLRASQLQLAEAADLAKIAYWEHDEATGEFIFNDAFYELYGTTAELEGGYRMAREEYRRRFVHPDDLEELRRQVDKNRARPRTDDHERYEHRGVRRDGEVIHILNRNRVIMDPERRILKVVGVNQDITARKRMEEALRESETKLRAILEGSRDAIGVSKDGIHTFANPAYVSLFGYESADELIGAPIIDLVAPESRGLVEERVRKRARGESVPPLYEVTALRKDGTTFLMESTVSTYTLKGEQFSLAVMRDITERRRAEDEVRMLKHSIDVHYDGAYWMNTGNEFIYVNEAACKALGYEHEELIGKTVFQVNPRATPEGMRGVWERLREGGSFLAESVHCRKDGSEFPVEIVTTYVQFGGREFACGFARDISEKKKLEGQLRQAQKMEAVGTLAGGVAHDFNNLLFVIMGCSNLIQAQIGDDDRVRPYIDQVIASSEKAADLTQRLLAFSRKQRITLEPHNMNDIVRSTAKLLGRLLPEDIELKVELTSADVVAHADVGQMDQVLMNLATNARDAMPRGGSLIIKTEVSTLDEEFHKTHGFGRPGRYVVLSVSDSGAGMDGKTIARIFDPFFTTKEVGKGTGLGLASVYGTVKQHRGYITVSSELDRGTSFRIYLPLVDTPHRQESALAEEIHKGTETVLVAEDDPDVRRMLTRVLANHGYVVMQAVDGEDAVRVYEENKIDLVILDVVMPGKNGKEAFDEIAKIDHSTKAIFVSGYTGDIVIDRGIQSESVDFIQKPVSVPGLLSKVREVLDR